MSLEAQIEKLNANIVDLINALDGNEAPLLVPKFLTKGSPDLVTKKNEDPGLITDDAGLIEEDEDSGLTAKQIAGRKAAKTRAANKAKKEAERLAAKEESETEVLSETVGDETEELFFSEEVEVEEDSFFDEAEAEQPAGLSVMGEDDPRGALRKHLNNMSKMLQASGKTSGLADLLRDKEAGFGYKTFPDLPEDKFDDFLNAAADMLTEADRAQIG